MFRPRLIQGCVSDSTIHANRKLLAEFLPPGARIVTFLHDSVEIELQIQGPCADQETWWAWADVCWRDDMEASIYEARSRAKPVRWPHGR